MTRACAKLCISSTSGGGGKTFLSLGLGATLRKRGLKIKPFKKGPDYIDAAWLGAACGLAATNLDPFFLGNSELKDLYASTMAKCDADLALLEGNRGLYDGLDEKGSCSTAALCRNLDFPILLTLDCAKSTRTMAAIIKGLTEFEENLQFIGVILSNVGSRRHENSLKDALAASCSLPVLGCLPRLAKNPLPERHMGLATIGGKLSENAEAILETLGTLINDNCDVEAILKSINCRMASADIPEGPCEAKPGQKKTEPVIGYIQDEAFWFYYPENLEALQDCGANLRPLSFLHPGSDKDWSGISALYIGGGFPEDYCEQLSASPRIATLRHFGVSNLPIYAECGGLLLLCEKLVFRNRAWPMAGLFPLEAHWANRPQGLGYVEARVTGTNPFFPKNFKFRGHEFHYSSCLSPESITFQLELERGTGIANGKDGVCIGDIWGSYTHIFGPAVPIWAKNFVALASSRQQIS